MYSRTIRLSENIITDAAVYAETMTRTIPKQIEHWVRIGKIAEENPDLSYNFIKDILLAQTEKEFGTVTEYKFG